MLLSSVAAAETETTLPRSLRGAGPMNACESGVSVGAGDVRVGLPFPSRADILFAFGLTHQVGPSRREVTREGKHWRRRCLP